MAERELLATRAVTEITGVASCRAARLAPYGINTCLDYARADRHLIRHLLTVDGERLGWELNGEAVRPIQTTRAPHKTLSRGGGIGIGMATDDPRVVDAWPEQQGRARQRSRGAGGRGAV